ncbi:RHS repeat-associated core domain-containing protein [Methylocapsa sp. S129]|uniref:RHS repeat-associated core domain-containing protein n=1 Tax=Methylocapsa sp. S129 TaxID=1641869 RepID=UPI00131D3AFD|nr:RHS repeat-associated core domain-containing protein [Methylocapsa sp. S129]
MPASSESCQCKKGDPIDLPLGYLTEHFVDYETSGPFPLKFERYYSNNGRPRFTTFGHTTLGNGGWRSNFDATMFNPYGSATYPHALYFSLPNGRQLLFVDSTGAGNYVPGLISGSASVAGGKGVGESLSLNTTTSQITLTTTDGANYVFSQTGGALTTINFRGGYSQSLTYYTSNVNYAPTSGLLSTVTDSLGRSLGFQYDTNGHLAAVTAGGANVATYTYVGNPQANAPLAPFFTGGIPPNVSQMTGMLGSATLLPANETSSYAYADANNPYALTSYTDARGVVYSTWTYNAQFQAISSVLAGPVGQTTIAYNPTSQTTTTTNALGEQEVLTYSVSASNNALPTQIQKQAVGSLPVSTTAFQYDSNDFLSQITDAEGRITSDVNDPTTGLPTSITRGYGTAGASTTTYTWNDQWRVPTQVVEPGRTSVYAWSASGQLTSSTVTDTTTTTIPYSTNGQTRTLTYAYGANNLLASVTGPLAGEVVSYTYNSTGFIQTITDELGHVTTVTAWNSLGQPASLTDPNGIVTDITYDGDGRVLTIAVGVGSDTPATTIIAWSVAGDITKITEPNGAWQAFAYDDARRLTTVTDSLGNATAYVRDAMGNATSVTLVRANTTTAYAKSQVFDQLGRLFQSIGVSSQTYAFGYDRTDNVTSVTDPQSNVFSNGFDALNRLISQTNEDGAIVNLTRNGVDDITAYQDPRNLTTSYVRNGFGEIIQEASPDRGTLVYQRDARGQVIQRTDARGVSFTYTYDLAGRILGEQNFAQASDNVWYVYDQPAAGSYPIGRLTTAFDSAGQLQRTYDQQGYLSQESRLTGSAPWLSVGFTHDLSGNLIQMALPSGRQINWIRDGQGRVNEIAIQGGAGFPNWTDVANPVAFNPYGHVASLSFGNGLVGTYGVDTDYHVTSVEVAPASGPALINRALSWTGEELTSITDAVTPADSEAFTYTPSHRLASASGAYGSLAWTYDAVGNRATQVAASATQTYAYPMSSNQLASIAQTGAATRSFAYDASGNRASDTTGASVLNAGYDGHGHLATFQNGSTTDGTYAYDAFSRLVQRVVSSGGPAGTTQYLYDESGHVIVETDGNGVSLREYIWLDDLPVAIIDQVNTASPILYYVHADHLNRPIMVTDSTGASVWQAVWTPFGAPLSITGTLTYDARFPGQWFQIENGLNWNWNRHYDPTTGRYVQVDPLGLTTLLSDGPSVYGYAGQAPLGWTDPRGLCVEDLCIGETAIGVGVATWIWTHFRRPSDPPIPPGDGSKCGDDDHCYRQYDNDMKYCGERYSFSSSAYGGCTTRAATNLDLCLRGLPQIPVWKDPDVDGVPLPKPPGRRK